MVHASLCTAFQASLTACTDLAPSRLSEFGHGDAACVDDACRAADIWQTVMVAWRVANALVCGIWLWRATDPNATNGSRSRLLLVCGVAPLIVCEASALLSTHPPQHPLRALCAAPPSQHAVLLLMLGAEFACTFVQRRWWPGGVDIATVTPVVACWCVGVLLQCLVLQWSWLTPLAVAIWMFC